MQHWFNYSVVDESELQNSWWAVVDCRSYQMSVVCMVMVLRDKGKTFLTKREC